MKQQSMEELFIRRAAAEGNHSPATMVNVYDSSFSILYQNACSRHIMGDHRGRHCFTAFCNRNRLCRNCLVARSLQDGREHWREHHISVDGILFHVETASSPVRDVSGEFLVGIEITSMLPAGGQKEISPASNQDNPAGGRTLGKGHDEDSDQLQQELVRAKKDIDTLTKALAESSIALKVLSNQQKKDRDELEFRVIANVKNLIIPHVTHLKDLPLSSKDRAHVTMLESRLLTIASPLSNRLSTLNNSLTAKEIQVASLIKDGLQDKEISAFIGISPETVKSHRQNIRKKLGIQGKRTSLKIILSSLAE